MHASHPSESPAPSGGVAAGAPPPGLAFGFGALTGSVLALIVLGALVRGNDAGLACPDWPLCFGELVPQMDLEVAFEWTHRVVAGGVGLTFAALALLTLRRRESREAAAGLLAVAAALLAVQILLGALTVWKLLAAWTVTSHLVTGNAFAVVLLWTTLALRERASPRSRAALAPAARAWLWTAAALLVLQVVAGGLVASRYAGLACPEWPACNGGVWFPTWRGTVGVHLFHRWNALALLLALALAARATRGTPFLGRVALAAVGLACAQLLVGIANVLMALPIEITGLHSALAAGLVLCLSVAVREAWLMPSGRP